MTYHPRDPTSKNLQRQWHQHLLHLPWESPLWRVKNKNKIPIAIRFMYVKNIHPKNLVNIFTYKKIDHFDGTPVSSYLEKRLGARPCFKSMIKRKTKGEREREILKL